MTYKTFCNGGAIARRLWSLAHAHQVDLGTDRCLVKHRGQKKKNFKNNFTGCSFSQDSLLFPRILTLFLRVIT